MSQTSGGASLSLRVKDDTHSRVDLTVIVPSRVPRVGPPEQYTPGVKALASSEFERCSWASGSDY